MDAKITVITEQQGNGFYLAQFKTAELSVHTYYIESNKEAAIIDPTYDVKVYHDFIAKRNSTLKYTILTHYQGDYLSGHTQFEAPIVMGPSGKRNINKFQVKEYEDGSQIVLGSVKIQVIHTPGHTSQSTCYLLIDNASAPVCVFTGDTVFLGDIGRPDLAVNPEAKVQEQTSLLFDSLQKLKKLDGKIRVYSGHGSGSSCGKTIAAGNFCTIQGQKEKNNLFKMENKEQFIKNVCSEIASPPKYHFHDAKMNQIGVCSYKENLEKANHPLSVEQFSVLSEKIIVIDSRAEPESIIRGNNIFWLTAKGTATSWAVNIILPSPETEYIVFADPGKWEDTAERLFRVGFFNLKGYNNFTMKDWKGQSWKPVVIKFDQMKDLKDPVYYDCRNKPEWKSTGIIDKSVLLPLNQLQKRALQLKDHKNILALCRTGMRARVAASILMHHGIQSTILAETVTDFKEKGGLNMVPYEE